MKIPKQNKMIWVLSPLIIGIFIYLIYRSQNLLYFKIIKSNQFLYKMALELRELGQLYRKLFPTWVIYSLPDGLWLLSFGATMMFDRVMYFMNGVTFTFILLFMLVVEIIQKFFGGHGSLIGTFDSMDVVFYILAYLIVMAFSLYDYLMYTEYNGGLSKEEEAYFPQEFAQNIFIIGFYTILALLPSLF